MQHFKRESKSDYERLYYHLTHTHTNSSQGQSLCKALHFGVSKRKYLNLFLQLKMQEKMFASGETYNHFCYVCHLSGFHPNGVVMTLHFHWNLFTCHPSLKKKKWYLQVQFEVEVIKKKKEKENNTNTSQKKANYNSIQIKAKQVRHILTMLSQNAVYKFNKILMILYCSDGCVFGNS